MSRGGYLNLYDSGNYSATRQRLTVYVVSEAGDDEYSSLYADSDFGAFNADEAAANIGEACEVRRLIFQVVETEVVYTTDPEQWDEA